MVTNIQHLNEDVLDIIVAFISQRDAGQLALTSRTMSAVARPRVLSSLRVATPRQTLSFHEFILWEDGYRLQYLRKLGFSSGTATTQLTTTPHLLPSWRERETCVRLT
ncbi:uncharacterized protein B0H18DRAFT_56601 [Fomitopsis serialis]|uniref:uncharacterized protein n=1 Tax=Fomitopsis serialis TaxID=139415 RepID=UPI00200780F3|nr:uncharacterized protein B0H18DRAFT_56601 [Neoantrodia serialis]KAH9916872.1 hypothetical protein B0H18DRAFT_56601 [Neoantrodia serialis]